MENLSFEEMEKVEGGFVPVMAALCGGMVAGGMGDGDVENYIIALLSAGNCHW